MRAGWKSGLAIIVMTGLCCVGGPEARAGGLTTHFAKVFIKNVSIGNTYRTSQLANLPLVITNDSQTSIGLEMSVIKPKPEDKYPPGCEAIPDTSWVRLEEYTFKDIKPGREARTDVIISIPDDEAYRGKKYMVYLLSRTAQGMVRMALKSKLIIEIYEGDQAKVDQDQAEPQEANFYIEPESFAIKEVSAIQRSSLSDLCGREFKISNMGEKQFKEIPGWVKKILDVLRIKWNRELHRTYTITSVSVPDFLLREYYQPLPDPSFVKFRLATKKHWFSPEEIEYKSKIDVEIKGKTTQNITGYIDFDPTKADLYKGKKYVFAVAIETGGVKRYVRGFIDMVK